MIWYDMIWHGVIWYNIIWRDMIWYDMIDQSTKWYYLISRIRCRQIWCIIFFIFVLPSALLWCIVTYGTLLFFTACRVVWHFLESNLVLLSPFYLFFHVSYFFLCLLFRLYTISSIPFALTFQWVCLSHSSFVSLPSSPLLFRSSLSFSPVLFSSLLFPSLAPFPFLLSSPPPFLSFLVSLHSFPLLFPFSLSFYLLHCFSFIPLYVR